MEDKLNQKSKTKMQNDKEKFKESFIQRLINFSLAVLRLNLKIKQKRECWVIMDQLIRSATSIGANVVEAKGAASKKDYCHFFEIALKSANETRYWLILLSNFDIETEKESNLLLKEVGEIAKVLGASILTLKGKR
ncbi:MAG: four helix bundle protein [bacterium]|nr:four helix bundle protein [bacterium]